MAPYFMNIPILINLHWENGSIINGFYIVAPNNLKPSWCTPIPQDFFEDTKSMTWSIVVWEISTYQTKQNKTNHLAFEKLEWRWQCVWFSLSLVATTGCDESHDRCLVGLAHDHDEKQHHLQQQHLPRFSSTTATLLVAPTLIHQ